MIRNGDLDKKISIKNIQYVLEYHGVGDMHPMSVGEILEEMINAEASEWR